MPGAATSDDHHVNEPHLAAGEQNDEGRLLGGVPTLGSKTSNEEWNQNCN